MMTKQDKWRGWLNNVVLWGQGAFLLLGLYPLIVLQLLEIPLPRAAGIFQAALTTAGIIFLLVYFSLWKVATTINRIFGIKGFAYLSLALSAFVLLSSWYLQPRQAADRASNYLFEAALDITDVLSETKGLPDDCNDPFFWIDFPQESTRELVAKRLSPAQLLKFNYNYERIQYLRARVKYLEDQTWPHENMEHLPRLAKAKLEDEKRMESIVDAAIWIVALSSAALAILSEAVPKNMKGA